MSATFWHDRRVLVTGATGLVGRWLIRRLRRRRRRRRLPRPRLGPAVASSCAAATAGARHGRPRRRSRDQRAVERALGEYEIDTVIHLAAQTIVGVANRNPVSTFEANIRGHLDPARGLPPQPDSSSASSSRRTTRRTATSRALPYTEDTPLDGRHPYDVSKACADLIAQTYAPHLRPAGRDHPLRQLLRRRRPQLEPHRARHDPLASCAASGR